MHGTHAFWPSLLDHRECARVRVGDMTIQAQIAPAMAFGVEGSLLSRFEACDFFRVGGEKFLVFAQREAAFFDAQRIAAVWERGARFDQFLARNGKETKPIEETQQPGFFETLGLPQAIPHLKGAPDELIAARTLHAIYAEIGAADADCVFGRPRARGIVLGGDEAMARIERRRDRRAEVDVAETQNKIAGLENDPTDLIFALEPVDPANEFDVRRTPGRVRPHQFAIFFYCELGLFVV